MADTNKRYDRYDPESKEMTSIFETADEDSFDLKPQPKKARKVRESTRLNHSSSMTSDPSEGELTCELSSITRSTSINSSILFKALRIEDSIVKGFKNLDQKLNETQKKLLELLSLNGDQNDLYIQLDPFSEESLPFLINSFQRIDTSLHEPQVVILSPTTELVCHITRLARQLTRYTDITLSDITADNRVTRTIDSHVLISTLGTLLFALRDGRRNIFDIRRVKLMILFEFQILIGSHRFTESVRELIKMLKKRTQIQIFSSCFDSKNDLDFVKRYSINLKSYNFSNNSAFERMLNFIVPCENYDEKYRSLITVLRYSAAKKVLIFTLGRQEAQMLERNLAKDRFRTLLLTSDLSINERMDTIEKFSSKKDYILVLNYPLNVGIRSTADHSNLVINFGLPIYSSVTESFFNEYYYRCASAQLDFETSSQPKFVINIFDDHKLKSLCKLKEYFPLKLIKLDPITLNEKSFEQSFEESFVQHN